MKLIPLTQGKFAKVSDRDYVVLSKYNWFAGYNAKRNVFVAQRNDKTKTMYMHSVINKTPAGFDTDHIDGDTLNNQRSNLRTTSRGENMMNRKINKNNVAGFKGVSYKKLNKKWTAQIQVNKKKVYLGLFDKKEDAYKSYCEACYKYHGKFANVGK